MGILHTSLNARVSAIPEDNPLRHLAEQHLAKGAAPVAMRDIPDRHWKLFARNQKRTVIHRGLVAIPLDEFLRIAHAVLPNIL